MDTGVISFLQVAFSKPSLFILLRGRSFAKTTITFHAIKESV